MLYDYYRNWEQSAHGREEIGCSDCHGGNPSIKNKNAAHRSGKIRASDTSSPVNYRNIPATCSKCHEEFYDHYRKSTHFKKLVGKRDEQQGPNCVTCHLSVGTTILNVNTVRATCELCHNEEKDNHPEIPARAEHLLNKFLSVHRFYRFITVRSVFPRDRVVFDALEERTAKLFFDWHTFDLDTIEHQTDELLQFLKIQRDEIKKRPRKK